MSDCASTAPTPSEPPRHWAARPLPSHADAVFYRLLFASGLVAHIAWVLAVWIATGGGAAWWMRAGVGALIFALAFAAFVWFFGPMRTIADEALAPPETDDRARRARFGRMRRLAIGSTIAGVPLALALPVLALALAVEHAVESGTSGRLLATIVAVYLPVPVVGTALLRPLPEAIAVWRRRLGRDAGTARGDDDQRLRTSRNALLSVLVLTVIASPSVIAAGADARARADALGQWRVVEGERVIELVNGARLTVPDGWTAYVSTDAKWDRELGVGQAVSLSPADESMYVSLSIITSAPAGPVFDPAAAAEGARENGFTDVRGPEHVEIGGWSGTVAAWLPRGGAEDELLLAARLKAAAGDDIDVLSSFGPDSGLAMSGSPSAMLERIVQLIRLQPSTEQGGTP